MHRIASGLALVAAFCLAQTSARAAAPTVLPFGDSAYRNWSQDSDTLYVTADAADLAAKLKGASKLWVVLSARSLLPEFWTDPSLGVPDFTERCVVKKDYD